MRRRRIGILAAAVLLIAAVGLLSVARTLRRPTAIAEQRAVVQELRAATDSCHTALAATQGELLAYSEWLDSVRGRVRDMEGLHPRGVPADSYRVYIEKFHTYNDSAAVWEERVAELQQERDECAATTTAHNAAIDSLRVLLQQQQQRRR
jgi:hypothetical protein